MTTNPAEIFFEQLYVSIYEGGVLCRGCIHNRIVEEFGDYVSRKCSLPTERHYECPGIALAINEINKLAKAKGIEISS